MTAVHHLFLTPEVIEKRKPLSSAARRAGWVGCNIRLDLIAPDAQIEVVHKQNPTNPQLVREKFQQFNRLKSIALNSRGWATLTLRIVRSLNKPTFSLDEIYAKQQVFSASYPETLLSGYKSNRFNWLQISPKSLSQSIS